MLTHYDANDRRFADMTDVLDPDELNDLSLSEAMLNIIYIKGIAYELESFTESLEDGTRRATLKVYRPF